MGAGEIAERATRATVRPAEWSRSEDSEFLHPAVPAGSLEHVLPTPRRSPPRSPGGLSGGTPSKEIY